MSSLKVKKSNSYLIRTFGCQMNVHDSEHVSGVLENAGWVPAATIDKAELLLFNTCSVRKSAEDKVWGNLSSLLSRENKLPRIAVFGCMAQRYGLEIIRRFPNVDLVFGLHSLGRLPDLLQRSSIAPTCDLGNVDLAYVDNYCSKPSSVSRAWVPVSYGCNNYCAYCVVPNVRGKERSRSLQQIKNEVERLASCGVIEVTLLGQNVNSYGQDLDPPHTFFEALEVVSSVEGIRRVKFETSHPRDLTEDILQIMAEKESICEHLHLPVQSGSDRVLSSMNRGYTRDYYIELATKAREVIPDLVMTTDIIVGFPGECEDDFNNTLDLAKQIGFDAAYIFLYSLREGTPAASMLDDVAKDIKLTRFRELSALQDEITSSSIMRLIGQNVEVLVEGPAKKGDYHIGRTRGHQVVLLPAESATFDSLLEVKVEGAGRHTARGSVIRVIRDPISKIVA